MATHSTKTIQWSAAAREPAAKHGQFSCAGDLGPGDIDAFAARSAPAREEQLITGAGWPPVRHEPTGQ
jgi:hypothetical protein